MKKMCNNMQKFVKKITNEKECDIRTDHQCNVENFQQCNQVPKQENVRECNLVNNSICNSLHGDEGISVQCKEVHKEKGWDEPTQVYQNIPKMMCQNVSKKKSFDKP